LLAARLELLGDGSGSAVVLISWTFDMVKKLNYPMSRVSSVTSAKTIHFFPTVLAMGQWLEGRNQDGFQWLQQAVLHLYL
jgi:hypothetical protein